MGEAYKIGFRDDLSALQDYLFEAVEFLAVHNWIYDVKNTDILVFDVLKNIPEEWRKSLLSLTIEEIRQVPFGFIKENWPKSLIEFLNLALKLAGFRHSQAYFMTSMEHIVVPDFVKQNTSSKKINEIIWMAAAVEKALEEYECSIVLDIGSGLGYLDQILHYNFGVITIGFESVKERTDRAKLRLQNGCSRNMHYINFKIDDGNASVEEIQTKLHEVLRHPAHCFCGRSEKLRNNSSNKVMIIGLHSCGNLMQDMMKLFMKMSEIEVFLCVGCCYHLIPLNSFPLSEASNNAILSIKNKLPDWSPSITGLRLGCQYTREHWRHLSEENHLQQEKCLFYRAILQKLLVQENLKWCKPRRHVRKCRDVYNFDNFISFAFQNCSWLESEKEERKKQLQQYHQQEENHFPLVRVLNVLQILLQPVWEGFILADRLSYLMENSIKANISIFCDELLSPRNVILFAIK